MVKLNSLFPFILLILFSTKIETTNSDESNFDHDINGGQDGQRFVL
jgi:hypothetical protein